MAIPQGCVEVRSRPAGRNSPLWCGSGIKLRSDSRGTLPSRRSGQIRDGRCSGLLRLIVRWAFNELPAAIEKLKIIGDNRIARIERISLLKLAPRRRQIAAL